ncbi:MAG TPA: ABC transporter permease [Terriglobales bacterium]|nr:ABC transporter permease [Terriglobales bacterium]
MFRSIIRKIRFLREPARIAVESMRVHKLRTFLTLLGIILSVSTLIFVISLIEGTNIYIADRVANLGSNVFLVNQFGLIRSRKEFLEASRRNKPISYEDYEALRDTMEMAAKVGLEGRRNGKVRYGVQNIEDVSIRGVSASIGDMDVEEPEQGRYITDGDDLRRANMTLIGADIATKLYPGLDPIGKAIYIDGHEFEIVGVAKPIGSVMGQPQDNFVYMPVRTFLKIYGSNINGMSINVQSRGGEWTERTQEEARAIMRARRHLSPNEPDSFGILGASTLMDLWKQLTGMLAISMVGIVGLFSVIGGVVVMNVMLTAVTERTREVGIRKALGAKRADIQMQFIMESVVMCGFGGIIGIVFAGSLSVIVDKTTPLPMSMPLYAVALALGISTVIGLFFGIYPARKAARLDPIEAIRHEN